MDAFRRRTTFQQPRGARADPGHAVHVDGRHCAIAVPRDGGNALLQVEVGVDGIERTLRRLGADPERYVLGRARLAAVLPKFRPTPEPVADDDPPIERVSAACVMARPLDGSAAILISGGNEAELEWVMRKLGVPPPLYVVAGASLAEVVLVDGWDHEQTRRFEHG